MRAVIYTRVSTEEQEENFSLRTQLDACRRYAAQHGMHIVAECSDTATGSTLERPGLQKVRQILATGGCDALIVYQQDRLSRNLAHTLLLRDELHSARGTLHTVSRGPSTDSAESRLFDSIEGAFAEFERLKIRERLLRGKRGKLEAGLPLGQGATPPYGYCWEGRKTQRRLVVNDQEAAVIRQIFAWYLDGISVQTICRRLDAAGVPTPADTRARSSKHLTGSGERSGAWGKSTVYAILRSRTYVGDLYYPSHGMSVAVPPLVSPADWQAAQEKLTMGRKQSLRNTRRHYLLRSRLRCVCGYTLIGRTTARERFAYYVCLHKRRGAKVPHDAPTYYRADRIERAIWGWICTTVLSEERIYAALAEQDDAWAARRAALEAERSAYQRQIEAAENQIAKLIQLFSADVLSLEEVAAQKRLIATAKESASRELERVERELRQGEASAPGVEELLRVAAEIRAIIEQGVSPEIQARVVELLDVHGRIVIGEDGGTQIDAECRLTGDNERLTLVPIVSTPLISSRLNCLTLRDRLPLAL